MFIPFTSADTRVEFAAEVKKYCRDGKVSFFIVLSKSLILLTVEYASD